MLRLLFFTACLLSTALAQTPGPDWWTFQYPNERPLDGGALDLRFLNEAYAGEHGFIRLSPDGEHFVHGTGEEIRFWPSNGANNAKNFSDEELARFARFLARMGVNMVRFHGSINPPGKGTDIMAVDTAEVEAIWRSVAAFKKEGIYSVISPFWPHNGHMGGWVPEDWGIDGYSGEDGLWGVMYFHERMQEAYKNWVRYLYTTPNDYTGVALKDEPAVGLIQIQNEDGVFFWTMNSLKPELKALIATQFTAWVQGKYGSLAAARQHWGAAASVEGDDWKAGKLGLYGFYLYTQPHTEENALRLRDQVEFYAYKQRSFYDEITAYYRHELGCRQLINANNWKTANPGRLLDLERWSNAGADVIATNRYFGPEHTGPNDGWRVEVGHFYGSPSALKHPDRLPSNIKHVAGRPTLITESGWNLPNKYQTEGPLLIAAYGGLTGLDGFFWFHPSAPTYDEEPYYTFTEVGGWHPMTRWSNSTPGQIGMFPANALIHRLGYVQAAPDQVVETRSLESLYRRELPTITEEKSFDPNRDKIDLGTAEQGALSPLTYLTGQVKVHYGQQKDSVYLSPAVAAAISGSTIRSVTGEHWLDYEKGLFTLNTPKARAVTGFLAGNGPFELGDLTIESDSRYATIELVAMDGKPLEQSEKVLLQVGTEYRPTDWAEEPATFDLRGKKTDGYKILATGRMPWKGAPAQGRISLTNPHLRTARILDAAGYEISQLALERAGGRVNLALPAEAMYVLLER